MHAACVLGLGLIAISAAQFEYADPRSVPPMHAQQALSLRFIASVHGGVKLTCSYAAHGDRNMIAKCMLGLHILLSYAMLQDWKPGGQTQTPVMIATGIMSFLYSICCSLFPDKDQPTPTPSLKSANDKKAL